MKTIFENPFIFSILSLPNERFEAAIKEICGETYIPPRIVVLSIITLDTQFGTDTTVTYVTEWGEVKETYPHYIINIPSDKDIAKNKKIYDFWKSTVDQLNQGGNK